MDDFERALLPGLPVARIRAYYASAPGKEIETGKFMHPESSAALAANAFGWFLERESDLPPLHGTEELGWPASSVEVEQVAHFPWNGGRHPCLDVLIRTSRAVIGVESKRYEPFRDRPAAKWSDAYWRPAWGERMRGYQRVRDLLRDSPRHFSHLDGAQLVKHAFGLRTAAHRENKEPALVYLYAEPASNPHGTQVTDATIERHREEIADFRARVAGDEVTFHTISYAELISRWRKSGSAAVRKHAQELDDKFFGMLRGTEEVWSEWMADIPTGNRSSREFCAEMFHILDENWKAARGARAKLPSRENWRWPVPICTLADNNRSPEVALERAFIRACEAQRTRTVPAGEHIWCNQVPVASGVRTAFDRRRAIDLVRRRRSGAFDFVELKVGSDDPLSAARQIVEYGLLWLISRRDKLACGYESVLITANDVRLCVLAPGDYFKGHHFGKLAKRLSGSLESIAAPLDVKLSFCFQQFPGTNSPGVMLSEDALISLFENRQAVA